MNNTHNISSCDITPTLMYCNYRWYSNPSFFIGLVCGMFSIVTVAPPYWYVGTHGPLLVHIGACLGVICTYIALLITLLCSITMTPLVAAQHNNAVELIVPLLIMRASLPFICQLTRATTRTRFSWVCRGGIKRSASTPRLQTENNSSLSINDHHHHGRHHPTSSSSSVLC